MEDVQMTKEEPVAWIEHSVDPELGWLGLIAHNKPIEGAFPVYAAPVPPDPRVAELEAALLEQVDLTIQLRDQLNQLRASLDPSRE